MFEYKLFFFASLFFNLLFLCFIFIWLIRKLKNYQSLDNYYEMRVDQFAHLPPVNNHSIVFLGDSITEMGAWNELLEKLNIKNRGISGDTTTGLLKRISVIAAGKPDKILIMIGINDICSKRENTLSIINNYRQILATLSKLTPESKIYIQSILPAKNRKFKQKIKKTNTELVKLAAEFNYNYLDLYSYFINNENELDQQYTSDGIHLNGKGYLLWQRIIEEII